MRPWQVSLVVSATCLILGIQQSQAASVIVPANGFAWTIPYFPGSNQCVAAQASLADSVPTNANLSLAVVDQADFDWFRASPSRNFKPVDSLVCRGSHVTNCLIAYGGLQVGVNYTVVIINTQTYSINVTYQYNLGCPSGSALLQGGGFAGSNVTTVSGGTAYGQTADISGSQCLSFYGVAEKSVRLTAWVVTTATASSFARNPSGYTSFPNLGFCNTTTTCNITLTNLNSSQNYTVLYQPDGQLGKSRYVAHSLLPSCLSTSFTVLPSKLLPLGPINKTTSIKYILEPDLNMTTAVITSSGEPVANTVYTVAQNQQVTYSATNLSPTATYWIGIQHNDRRNDSSKVFFTLLQPYYTGSSSSGRKLLQYDQAPLGQRSRRSLLADSIVSATAPAGSASLGAGITNVFEYSQQQFLASNGVPNGYTSDQASTAVQNARIPS